MNRFSFDERIVGLLFALWTIFIYLNDPVSIALKYMVGSVTLITIALLSSDFYLVPFRTRTGKLFLIFWGWIVSVSLLDGFFFSGKYFHFVIENGSLGLIWILESNRFWGLMLALGLTHIIYSEDFENGSRIVEWVFYWMLGLALIGGFLPYIAQQKWLDGGNFLIFGAWHTNSAKKLNVLIFFILATLVSRKRSMTFTIFLGLIYATFAGVYLTQSRGGIGSLVGGMVIFGGLYLYRNQNLTTAIKTVLFVLGAFLVIWLLPAKSHQAASSEVAETKEEGVIAENKRLKIIWPHTLELIKQNPIIGHPAGTFYPNMEELAGEDIPSNAKSHPHNVLLQILYEGGIIGFLLFLSFIGSVLYTSGYNYIFAEGTPYFLAVLCVTMTVVLAHGLVEAVNYAWMAVIVVQLEYAFVRFEEKNEPAG